MEGTAGGHVARGRGSRDGTGPGEGTGKGKGIWMGRGFLCCSPSTPPCPQGQVQPCAPPAPCQGSSSQGSASTWISVLEAQKGLGWGHPGPPGPPSAHAATPHRPTPGGQSAPAHGRTGTAPGFAPSPQRAEPSPGGFHCSAGGTEQILC